MIYSAEHDREGQPEEKPSVQSPVSLQSFTDPPSVLISGIGLFSAALTSSHPDAIRNEPVFEPLKAAASLLVDPRYATAFLDLERCGVHPFSGDCSWYDPFTGKVTAGNNSNIGEHVIAVALVAGVIADKAVNVGIISPDEKEECIRKALLHDVTKIPDIIVANARSAGYLPEGHHLHENEYISYLLTANGFSLEDAERLSGYGSETGHQSISTFLKPVNGELALEVSSAVAAIVHLADDMVSSNRRNESRILTMEERAVGSALAIKYPYLLSEGLGFSTGDTELVPVTLHSRCVVEKASSYYTLQIVTAEAISRWLQHHINPANTEVPGKYIKQLVLDGLSAEHPGSLHL